MRIAGVDPKTLVNEVVLVLPRGDDNIVFRARGLMDMEPFNAQCPQPKPPGKLTRDGWIPSNDDPTYQEVTEQWAKKRLGYIVAHSLEPSEIEWDKVKLNDPRTWPDWEDDLREGGFSDMECSRILALVMEANSLDEEKLKKAREVFLRGPGPVPSEFSGLATGPENTPSGKPVEDLESDHQA